MEGEEGFGEIEGESDGGVEEAGEEGVVADEDVADGVGFLEVDGDEAEEEGEEEKGEGAEEILGGDCFALIEGEEEENEGEHDDGGFGEKGEEEEEEGGGVERFFLGGFEMEVSEEGGEHEGEGEGVFSFGDPGGGFGVDGVDDEEECGEEGSGDFELLEDFVEEECGGGVKEDIDEVLALGGISEEVVFEPEEGGGEGEVVGVFGGEPDVEKACGGVDEGVEGDEFVVVEEEGAVGEEEG